MPEHKACQHIDREQRHLIAAEHDQGGEHTSARTGPPRRALERARQQPQRQRQEHQALDLADVLDARCCRAAERERQRRHQRAADMPAAVAEEQDHAGAAGVEQHEHQNVGEPRAWVRNEQRHNEMEGGEDQRLRIGDLRPAGKDVRRPERRLAGRERAGEECKLRIELRGGVVGNFDRARQPGRCQRQEGYGVEAERSRERKALRSRECPGISRDPKARRSFPTSSLQRKRAACAARITPSTGRNQWLPITPAARCRPDCGKRCRARSAACHRCRSCG